jgi:hypothetical protein
MIIRLKEESRSTTQERDKLQQEMVCLEHHQYLYRHLENVEQLYILLLKSKSIET